MTAMMLLVLACGRRGVQPPDSPGHSRADSDSLPDSDSATTAGEFVVVTRDSSTFADLGYVSTRWELSATAERQYQDIEGGAPAFDLVFPASAVGGAAVPLLVWFHGGAVGDDGDGEIPDTCKEGAIVERVSEVAGPTSIIVPWLAAQGWAIALPHNGWCDAWTGLGPTDPVDPEHHFGYYHTARVLDFLRDGGAGMSVGALYAWGTSAGGSATVSVLARYGEFAGAVADSSPCRHAVSWQSSPKVMEHLFGGPPTDSEAARRYRRASCDTLVADGLYTTPIFVTWNAQDTQVSPQHGTGLMEALEAAYPAAGIRFGGLDLDHAYPKPEGHVQSRNNVLPGAYMPGLLMQFLAGAELSWVEAELEDGACGKQACVGLNESSDTLAAFSRSGARLAAAGETGAFYQERVPAELVAGQKAEAVLVLRVEGASALDPATEVLELEYIDDSGQRTRKAITAGDLATPASTPSPADLVALVAQAQATRLGFTPTDPSSGSLRVSSGGQLAIQLDAVAWVVR